ncbi:MAG: Gingipain precursor, partial [Pseudomonadota bacterium]
VPLAGFSLAEPVDATDSAITITPEGGVQRIAAGRLYPVQRPENSRTGEDGIGKFQFDQATYLKGVKTPGQSMGVVPVFKGDANIQGYRFTPYGYDPSQEVITFYSSYLVTIKHPGRCFLYDRTLNKEWLSTRQDLGLDPVDQKIEGLPLPAFQFALNKAIANELRCAPPIQIDPKLLGARFLIVTHPNFKAAADSLKAHKQSLGLSTLVVTTADITGSTASATPTQIRNWIATYYRTHLVRPRWVLFMGDAEFIPTQYDQTNDWDSARNAGDIWYGQFQAGATTVTVPPFGIGRLPVDTLAQANTIVSKIKAYELNPPSGAGSNAGFYRKFTFASYFQGMKTDDRWFVETSEIVRDHLVGLGYNVTRLYTAPGGADPQFYNGGSAIPSALRKPGFAWNASASDIVSAVNAGTSVLFHRDHGWWTGWGDPSFSTSDLSSISVTGNRFPVVFSVNCASGMFDNETVDLPAVKVGAGYGPSPTTAYWAEAFLRKPDGALAVFGDTRSSSTIDNNHLTLGLFDAVFPNLLTTHGTGTSIRRLGDILNYAKTYISDVASGATSNSHPLSSSGSRPGIQDLRDEVNIYNLLGDPTVNLRLNAPLPIVIGNIDFTGKRVLVQAKLGDWRPNGAEFLTAVALNPDTGAEVGRGIVDANGAADIDLGDQATLKNVWVRLAATDGQPAQAAFKESDTDGDGVPDSRDNCTQVSNPDQRDADGDGYGNACDADLNNDGIVNSLDVSAMRTAFGTANPAGDLNGDGAVNALDISLLRRLFGTRPGPSAFHLGER